MKEFAIRYPLITMVLGVMALGAVVDIAHLLIK